MSALHIISRSPYQSHGLEQCLARIGVGHGLLLIENAVYAVKRGAEPAARIKTVLPFVTVYVLAPDLKARGIALDEIIGGVKAIDYAGFVDLAVEHKAIQSWH